MIQTIPVIAIINFKSFFLSFIMASMTIPLIKSSSLELLRFLITLL